MGPSRETLRITVLSLIKSEYKADNGPPGMEPDGIIEVSYQKDSFSMFYSNTKNSY